MADPSGAAGAFLLVYLFLHLWWLWLILLVVFWIFRSSSKRTRRASKAASKAAKEGAIMRLNVLPLEANEKRVGSAFETRVAIGEIAKSAGVLVTDHRIFIQPIAGRDEPDGPLIAIPISDAHSVPPAKKRGVFSLSYQGTSYSMELPPEGIDCLKGLLRKDTV